MKSYFSIIKKLILLLLAIGIGTYLGINIWVDEFNDAYLELWEKGLSMYMLFFMVIMFELTVNDEYLKIQDQSDLNMIIRIGYKQYYLKTLLKIFVKTFLYTLLIHISLIILMSSLRNFELSVIIPESSQRAYFSRNIFVNMGTFILLSSLGTALFCSSLYPVVYFIKNKYFYKFLPILVFFLSLIISMMVGQFVISCFDSAGQNRILLQTLWSTFIPSSLISPGSSTYFYPFIEFGGGIIIYGLVFIIGMTVLRRIRGHSDD